MRPALLIHNQLSLSIWQCILIHHILKEKANKVYQVLDGCLIEVTTIGELSLPCAGVRGRLVEVDASLFFSTYISGL